MKSYKQVEAETFYSNGNVDDNYLCDVRFGDGEIVVSYKHDEGIFHVWKGAEIEQGHFHLQCPNGNGKATLHLTPEGDQLEGSWHQDGIYGMWRIDLDEDKLSN